MRMFLKGFNGNLEEECRSTMLYDNMDLSRLMVQVQQVEESQKKRGTREARRPKTHDQPGLVLVYIWVVTCSYSYTYTLVHE